MRISERSYSGNLFRPRPELYTDPGGQLTIIATPWGPRSSAQKAIKIIENYFLSAQEDIESTTPFAQLSSLSQLANNLRVAIKIANDNLYNSENKDEYVTGIEILAIARSLGELAWTQVGYPYLLLDRPQTNILPLGNQQDLSSEFTIGTKQLPPLPNKMLGLDLHTDFTVESFRPQNHDRFICISRSHLPSEVFNLSPGDRELDNLSNILSKDDPDLPFWLGICELN